MNDERLMNILLGPRVTEKSTFTADKYRQFVFKVMRDATKPEIKQAVEKMFEVEVEVGTGAERARQEKNVSTGAGQTPGLEEGLRQAETRL